MTRIGRLVRSTIDPDQLTVGESSLARRDAVANIVTGTGNLRLGYFTARKSETISQVRMMTGTTAAAATPTLCRIGWWSVADNGNITLVASTANDTTLFATISTSYTRSLSVPYAKIAGQRYATGALIVSGAATPTLIGIALGSASESAVAPRMAGILLSQTDLPASYTGVMGDGVNAPYVALLP